MTARAHVAWLGLGSNLDGPAAHVSGAVEALAATPGVEMLAVSSFYRTAPVGGPADQPAFCNACVAVRVSFGARALLVATQRIEQAHGRVRDVRWGPRTLDIDMLAFDDLMRDDPDLTLPHPRAAERGFVLVPLAEIAPALTLGRHGRVADLLDRVGQAGVEPWTQVWAQA